MKKFLMIVLLVGAIPAVAVGQTVSCEGCTHVVSVYQGEGGFIATADGDMVTFVATCEGVTRSDELTPDADGVVSMLLTGDYACHGDDEDNEFRLGPIMDGGWYWITEDDNSAVGHLVSMDILDNEPTMITETSSVTMTDGKGAKLLKETATGRVGILPTILPVMEMEGPMVNTCSYTGTGDDAKTETSNCMLGDGGTTLRVQGPLNFYTGNKDEIPAGGMVTRPVAQGSNVEVTVDLWGNGSGHFTSGTVDNDETSGSFNPANLGHKGGTPLAGTLTAELAATGRPGSGQNIDTTGPDGNAGAGLTYNAVGNVGTLTIIPDPAYCGETANYVASVTFTATLSAAELTQVTPSIANTSGVAATHKIDVVCPAASANMGQELVPENPFPTTE